MRVAQVVTLDIPGKLWTMNAERRSDHWSHRQKATAEWRLAAQIEAKRRYRGVVIDPAAIHVEPHQRRLPLADCTAHFPPVKAAIDGLVDAGLLIDDDPAHLRQVIFHAPIRFATEGLRIWVFTAGVGLEGEK